MPSDLFTVDTPRELALAVRLSGNLRRTPADILLTQSLAKAQSGQLQEIIQQELSRTEAGLQLHSWRLSLSPCAYGARLRFTPRYFDSAEDRLWVRLHVYRRALKLMEKGWADPEGVLRTVRREIPFGDAGNPHCLSHALRNRSGVCQAISLYVMQLACRCGIPALVETGSVNGLPHAWNRLRIGEEWRRVDLCVTAPDAVYLHNEKEAPALRWQRVVEGLERTVTLRSRLSTVNGLSLPFLLGNESHVYPTRLCQTFNGAWQRVEGGLLCCLGNKTALIPSQSLSETPAHVPVMPLDSFARQMNLNLADNRICFTEGL